MKWDFRKSKSVLIVLDCMGHAVFQHISKKYNINKCEFALWTYKGAIQKSYSEMSIPAGYPRFTAENMF